ncbi:hypothetical protein D3C86_1705650 [compost metagenome]
MASGVEQQPGDLFAQALGAIDGVVVKPRHILAPAQPGQAAQQGFERGAFDIGHAAAQLHHVLARHAAQQLHHLVPLGNFHRALGRSADGWQRREAAPAGYKIAGLGLRRGQAIVFQYSVGLLDRAQADPVLDTQCAYRWQAIAGAIEALFNARAEQIREVYIEGHGVLRIKLAPATSTD